MTESPISATAPQAGPSAMRPSASRTTSAAQGAAKVFREFKWGLLTLFLLMVVVIGLVYDGGAKKKSALTDDGALQVPAVPAERTQEQASGIEAQEVAPIMGGPQAPPAVPNTPAGLPRGGMDEWNGTTHFSDYSAPQGAGGGRSVSNPVEARSEPRAEANRTEASRTEASRVERTYVVQAGDTLEGIAKRHFPGQVNSGLRAFAAANKEQLGDIHFLRPGMKLQVPSMAAPSKTAVGAIEVSAAQAGLANKSLEAAKQQDASVATYLVLPGDSLERIARKLFKDGNRWRDLFEWNRDQLGDPGHLKAGQKLRLSGVTEPKASTERHGKDTQGPGGAGAREQAVAAHNPAPAHVESPAAVSTERPSWMP